MSPSPIYVGDGKFINPLNDEVMENLAINNELLNFNEVKEIIFLESVGNFTRKYYKNGREYLLEDDLIQVEKTLPKEKFFRINESYIINVDYLKRIKSGAIKNVVLKGGIELNIAHDRYWQLIKFLKVRYTIW